MSRAARPARASDPLPDFRALLRRHGIRPDKRLGQHFLFDPSALDRVVTAAGLSGEETALEIGAGVGSLTLRLAAATRRVIAVEVDARLMPALGEAVADRPNVELVAGDILELDLAALVGAAPYLVVANIPYNITSHLLRRLLETPARASRLVLTVQEEVAERVTAERGKQSLLSLSVHLHGTAAIAGRIPAAAFHPPPAVDSAILAVRISERPRIAPDLIDPFFALARAGFGQKRKKLRNALSRGRGVGVGTVRSWIEAARLDPDCRAEDLRLDEWERLVRAAQGAGRTA
jgi:16S rRNA (adenine1518-N6/adenine1519-N6)-dimethyltransferase